VGAISDFIRHHYRHFNGAALVDAADAYVKHLTDGGQMLVTLAGAMSTAELGLSLAEMIRRGKVHAICCTGANLEEDVFNLVAHEHYVRIPQYRYLTPEQEEQLLDRHLNRVTDTCIPEFEAIRRIEGAVLEEWERADTAHQQFFPHEFMYKILLSGALKEHYQIDPKDSWLLAAAEKSLPMFVPGWEDSTLGNIFVSHVLSRELSNFQIVKSGLETMAELARWYVQTTMGKSLEELPAVELTGHDAVGMRAIPGAQARSTVGFFQIGGGIAGDFPICVVPMLQQDLQLADTPRWGYFCQISDSTTSYGSYSGAVPNEKITWGKLSASTPKFIIESDATIVAPLIFAHVLGE